MRANRFAAWRIYWEGDLPDDEHQHREDNAAFFSQTLWAVMRRSARRVVLPRSDRSASTRRWSR